MMELVDITDLKSVGFMPSRFESGCEYQTRSGPLAQLVEQLTFNQWVTGSNPVGLTIK